MLWAHAWAFLLPPDRAPTVDTGAPRVAMPESNSPAAWSPVAEPHRAQALDVLRGFAILGVLVANTLVFAYPMASTGPDLAGWKGTGPADGLALLLVGLLVEGKFYTLLSVLFGAGLALQLNRAEASGQPFVPFFLRRAIVLLALGVLHGVLLFAADILAFYAVVSIATVAFHRLPPRKLALAAVMCAAAGVLVLSLFAWSHREGPAGRPLDWRRLQRAEVEPPVIERSAAAVLERFGIERDEFFGIMVDEARICRDGTWAELTRLRAITSLLLSFPSKVWLLGLVSLAHFLIGMSLVRRPAGPSDVGSAGSLPWFLVPREDEATRYRSWFYGGAGLGLGLVVVASGFGRMLPGFALAPVIYWSGTLAGVFLQSMGYAAGILMLCALRPEGLVVRGLAAVGRMALSNYVAQSVMLGFVFYGTGLGLFTRLTALPVVALSVPVFGLEVWLSRWWLRHFTMGPLEWAWRSLSYGTRLPLRRGHAVGIAG